MVSEKRFYVHRIVGGPHDGEAGIYAGDALVGLADKDSLLRCITDMEKPRGEIAPTRRIERNPDGTVKTSEQPKGGRRTAEELTKFVNDRYPMLATLSEELGAAVVEKMLATGSDDFAAALRDVTRTRKGAELWREHQNRNTMILSE